MKTFFMCIASAGLLLSGKASFAEETPLDLTVRGMAVRPQLMVDNVDHRNSLFKQEPTLSLDAKTRQLVIPALQTTSGGVTTKVGIRARKDGIAVRVQINW